MPPATFAMDVIPSIVLFHTSGFHVPMQQQFFCFFCIDLDVKYFQSCYTFVCNSVMCWILTNATRLKLETLVQAAI